jgi:hypothetical protein
MAASPTENLFADQRSWASGHARLAENIHVLRRSETSKHVWRELAEVFLLWVDCAHDEDVPIETISEHLTRMMRESMRGTCLSIECPARLVGRDVCINYCTRSVMRQQSKVITVAVLPTKAPLPN